MAIDERTLRQAVMVLSGVEGMSMDANHLVEDVFLLAASFPDRDDFEAATAATVRALRRLIAGAVTSGSLKYEFQGWNSFHYQHCVAQGAKADCRIVFRQTESGIEVKGFGHRHAPQDFYERLSRGRV